MRALRAMCLWSVVLVLGGCSWAPGQSPSQLRAAQGVNTVCDRTYPDMHPDLP